MKRLLTIIAVLITILGYSQDTIPESNSQPFYGTRHFVSMDGQDTLALYYEGDTVQFYSTDSVWFDKLILRHNTLQAIQGGKVGEYYHLTNAELTKLQDSISLIKNQFTNADEADPAFKAWDKSKGINISKKQLIDLEGIKLIQLDSAEFEISESQVYDLDHFTNANETDPVYSNDSVNIVWFSDTIETIATKYNIDTITHFTTSDETDPVFIAAIRDSIYNYELDSNLIRFEDLTDSLNVIRDTTDALRVDIGINQTNIADNSTEIDNVRDSIPDYEIDPIYAGDSSNIIWFQDTTDLIATKYDLDTLQFTTSDEIDPVFTAHLANDITETDTTRWGMDADATNEIQDISTDGSAGNISISNGSTLNLNVDDSDANSSNEIQSILLSNDTLYLSQDGDVDLGYLNNNGTDNQVLSIDSTSRVFDISIENGDTVSFQDIYRDGDTDATNELQNVSDSLDYFTNADESDPAFMEWNRKDGINISTKQITDLQSYKLTRLDSTGFTITESQISDLQHFTNGDETDPIFNSHLASGITATDTTRWGTDADATNELNTNASWNDGTNTISITDNGGSVSTEITGFMESQTEMITEQFEASADGNDTFSLSNTADATQDCRVSFNGNTMNPDNYTFTSSDLIVNVNINKYDKVQISYFK